MKKEKKGLYLWAILSILILGALTYDIIITNILSTYYCSQEPNPKTHIVKKVEYPESIYWEDNVYPGFSKADRELMIVNYLDGKHLKTMALNGDDGKVYMYHLKKPLWERFKKSHHTLKSVALRKAYAEEIMKDKKVYTKESMPKLNYTVTFNEVKLNSFAHKFLYSDETKVIENKTKEVIAYNRRYMRLFYNIEPKFFGNDIYHYYKSILCGDWYEFHLKVFDMLKWRLIGQNEHTISLNKRLYNIYVKGKK